MTNTITKVSEARLRACSLLHFTAAAKGQAVSRTGTGHLLQPMLTHFNFKPKPGPATL